MKRNLRLSVADARWILIMLVCAVSVVAWSNAEASEPEQLVKKLEFQTYIYPQEKVYVATDKNIYVAGDTIRFRAFLVDALKLTQKQDGSKYVYVEVIDPLGKNVDRIKVKEKDGIFAGIVPLPEEMVEGTYTLGGYTLFMKNQGENYTFRKPLPIKSRYAKKYRLETTVEGNVVKTAFTDRITDKPVKARNIVLLSGDEILRGGIHNRQNYDFKLGHKTLNEGIVRVKYDNYEKYVIVPKDSEAISVTFHPEGGYMIPGIVNKVAFKAIGKDGLSTNVEGVIVNSNGDKVASFVSAHDGMGVFELNPSENETYFANIDGKSIPLPISNPAATVLSLDTENMDSVTVRVNGVMKPGLILLGDNCGIVTIGMKVNAPEFKIPRSDLGAGLTQFYLVDSNNNILSSRLMFNRKGYVYSDSVENVPFGDYAITSRMSEVDNLNTGSIVSELMLSSDLNGHVENPDYYFSSPDKIKDRHLDNLLLTQGWKRYDIQNALKGDFAIPEEPMEIGGELSGVVKSRWVSKPVEGAVINVIAPEINYVGVAETDSKGRYVLNGLDWPDGTYFAVQAINKKGDLEQNLEIDDDDFIRVANLPEDFSLVTQDAEVFDNGAIWLDEVDVVALPSSKELRNKMLKALGVNVITAEDIKNNNYYTYDDIIYRTPGLRIVNGNLIYAGAGGPYRGVTNSNMVGIWVDGARWYPSSAPDLIGDNRGVYINTFTEFTQMYPLDMVESITIGSLFQQGVGGMVVTTKSGDKLHSWDRDLFIKRVTPKGYQDAAEAYQPHFTYDATQETVPTSYWYPSEKGINNLPVIENAKTVVEGITYNGQPFFGIVHPAKKE